MASPLSALRAGVGRVYTLFRACVEWSYGVLRAGVERAYALFSRKLTGTELLLATAYVAALASIGSFLWRGGVGEPTTAELLLLVVALGVWILIALSGGLN